MSRLANLPIAVRLGAAFGLLALALLAITLIATRAFGTFHDDTRRLNARDVRALAVAGQLGQDLQGVGRQTAEHLYVYDGDLKSQDAIQATIEKSAKQTRAAAAELSTLVAGTRAEDETEAFIAHATTWNALVDDALRQSRDETIADAEDRDGSRELYTEQDQPADRRARGGGRRAAERGARGDRRDRRRASRRAPPPPPALLLIVMVVAQVLALLTAVVITRSVVRPVRGLMDRLRSLDDALPDRADRGPRGLRRRRLHARRDAGHDAARGALDRRARTALGRPSTRCSPRRSARSRPTARCAGSSAS